MAGARFLRHAEKLLNMQRDIKAESGSSGSGGATSLRIGVIESVLLDLCRRQAVEPPRVHTIASISARVQLLDNGFGVATLPQAAVARLASQRGLRLLQLDVAMTPLPIHPSWRDDPATQAAAAVLDSVQRFNAPSVAAPRASSKKSMSP